MKIENADILFFKTQLMEWSRLNPRPLPWKSEKDPYIIWLSEIILQQTRVEQGLAYFERFRKNYPTVCALAAAPEDEILKNWEGLGYYARARNMHATAHYICNELDGLFPTTYEGILALKGIGTYTAAAIASFAYNLPYAVLDGNVFRVLARFLGIEAAVDTTEGKKLFANLAQQLLDVEQAGAYNQALMDFGAIQCTPQLPQCSTCPMQQRCKALARNIVGLLPAKSKKIIKKERYFHYLVIRSGEQVLLQKRSAKDIWQNLYEFPLIEAPQVLEAEQLMQTPIWKELSHSNNCTITRLSKPFRQVLTHQVIYAIFYEVECPHPAAAEHDKYLSANFKNLSKFAFPKIIDWYLQDNSLYLSLM